MITILRFPKGYQFFDANGLPLALGKLSYFTAGTTAPQDTYSDAAGNTPNANPVLLDGSGRLSVDVNLGPAANYKEILTASGGATVAPWPVDDIPKASSAGASIMVGASSGSAGNAGLVPQPQAGQQGSFLRGDGTWQAVSGGSGGGSATNIGVTRTSTKVTVSSSTGTGADIAAADASNAGVMSAADKTKLDGLSSGGGSQVNSDWNALSGVAQILNKPSLGTASAKDVPSSGNASTTQVVYGTDTRLSDARTPSAHASSHASGGSDALSLAASQVSGIPASLASQNLDNVSRIGIGTTDTNNKLSVSAPSVLFANSGDMRATISKGSAANTAAFNFQDNFSTRVQFGLLGDDNFGVQTSPDGATFKSAIVADKTSGAVTFPNTPGFTGDSGSGGTKGLVPAPGAGDAANSKFLKADGTWSVTPTGGGGEANTASNVGTAGVGVYKQKTGINLELKKINAASTKISVTDNTSASQVDLDINQANLALSADQVSDGTTNKAYTATEKTKLAGIASGATVQVNSDWNASSGIAQISNKPTLGTAAAKDIPATGNASATQVVYGTDTRLSDARTPVSHSSTLISDSTTAGRSMLTAADANAQTALLTALAGANGSSGGTKGLVPAPAATDNVKYLKGDGTWGTPSGGAGFTGTLNAPFILRDTTQTNISNQSGSQFQIIQAALQTTDATATNLFSIAIALSEMVMVRAFVNAMLSDSSGAWFQEVYRIFRRGSSGNAASVGSNYSTSYAVKDSSVNTSATMATQLVTTGLTDTLYVSVTGEASKTYNWFGTALVQRLKI